MVPNCGISFGVDLASNMTATHTFIQQSLVSIVYLG